MNLQEMTPEDLDQLRIDVLAELERRERLETIPATIADLAKTYEDGGGNRDDLLTALAGDQ